MKVITIELEQARALEIRNLLIQIIDGKIVDGRKVNNDDYNTLVEIVKQING